MSIQEHLDKIRNAVYGREVRESIAKGIETAYDDASEKDNANMEVKIARGTYPNLRSRLEEVDNKQQQNTAQLQQTEQELNVQLASKANQSEVRLKVSKIKSDDLDATLLGAMTGTGSVNLLSEPQDESVHSVKLSTSLQAVLSEGYAWEMGGVHTDGSIPAPVNNRIRTTNKVVLKGGTILKLLDSDVYQFGLAEYSLTDESFIKNHNWQQGDTFIIPNDNKYIIFMRRYSDTVLTDEIQLVSGKLLIFTNESLYYKLDELDKKIVNNSNSFERELTELDDKLANKGNNFAWEMGTIGVDGVASASNTRIRTKELVLLNEGDIIEVSDSNYDFVVNQFTLDTKTFVEGSNTFYIDKYTVPITAYYQIAMRKKDNTSLVGLISETTSKIWVFDKMLTDKIQRQISNANQQYVEKARTLLYKFQGTLGQGITFIGDELWGFLGNTSSDETTFARCFRYSLDYESKTVTETGAFFQNWGHCNTIDYCNETDTLIVGSGTGLDITDGYGDNERKGIYLFPNTSSFKNVSNDTQITLADYGIVIELPELESERQFQTIWGENNNRKYNVCYVLTNNGTSVRDSSTEISDMFIYKVLLGQGANNLGSGTFIDGKSGLEFNGTYKILKRYIGRDIYSPYECTQDAVFYNGKIYTGMGHDGVWIAEITLNEDGSFTMLKTRERKWYDDDGSEILLITQATTIQDDKLYVRVWEGKNQSVALHVFKL